MLKLHSAGPCAAPFPHPQSGLLHPAIPEAVGYKEAKYDLTLANREAKVVCVRSGRSINESLLRFGGFFGTNLPNANCNEQFSFLQPNLRTAWLPTLGHSPASASVLPLLGSTRNGVRQASHVPPWLWADLSYHRGLRHPLAPVETRPVLICVLR